MSTYRRPSVASVSDDGTFISSVEHQTPGHPAPASPRPVPLPPSQPPPPPPPAFRGRVDNSPSRLSRYDDRSDRYDRYDRFGRREISPPSPRGDLARRGSLDESPSPRSYSRRDVTPAPSARRYLPDSDSDSDYVEEYRDDRSDRSASPVSPVLSPSSTGGAPVLPKPPRVPSPPAGHERPHMTSTVNYRGPDGRTRRASLVISDDGSVREEDIPIEFDSDSDRDLPAGVESGSYKPVSSASRRPPVVERAESSRSPGSPDTTSDTEDEASVGAQTIKLMTGHRA